MAWHAYFTRYTRLGFVLAPAGAAFFIGCAPAPQASISPPLPSLSLSGEELLKLNIEYATRFEHRHSGTENNGKAVQYFIDRLSKAGLSCTADTWNIINYSAPVQLQNGICRLPGKDSRELLIIAHHDQSPATVQGADNDASGMAILISLAEAFAKEPTPSYSMVFLSADAEEYGMLGSRRYIETHFKENSPNIIAGISLDNLGKRWSKGIGYEAIGQFGGYSPAWFIALFQQSARAYPGLWVPAIKNPLFQVLDQAVPISLMDGGPLVASGIPALGLATTYDSADLEQVWQSYHSPNDRIEFQDAAALGQSGRIVEAFLRQLLVLKEFPRETSPYLFFEGRGILKGIPLYALFMVLPFLFGAAALHTYKNNRQAKYSSMLSALAGYLSIALPLFFSIACLRLFPALGLMDIYYLYPATAKDPAIFHPRWPAVILFLLMLSLMLFGARKLYTRVFMPPSFSERQSIAYTALTLCSLYLVFRNPFSLLFMVPAIAWLFIRERKGFGRIFNGLAFLLGGLVIYALLYFFGFVILRNDLAVLWYIQMMFSIGMIGLPSAALITAAIGAGCSLMTIGRPATQTLHRDR